MFVCGTASVLPHQFQGEGAQFAAVKGGSLVLFLGVEDGHGGYQCSLHPDRKGAVEGASLVLYHRDNQRPGVH